MLRPIIFLVILEQVYCCGRNITNLLEFEYSLDLEPNCDNILPIYPEKSIELHIPCDSDLNIWLIVNVENNIHKIFHSNLTSNCSRYSASSTPWRAPENTGLMIISNKTDQIQVKVKEVENICGYPYIQLKSNSTVIQNDVNFDFSQECVYRLVPQIPSSYDKIEIDFSDERGLKYQQRIYSDSNHFEFLNFEHAIMTEVREFDIKIGEMIRPLTITVQLLKNPCIDNRVIAVPSHSNYYTASIRPLEFDDECEDHSVYNITFPDLKSNEFVYFQHNVEYWNKRNIKVYQLDDLTNKIIDHKHWMQNIVVKTEGLHIKLKQSKPNYELKFTRVILQDGCDICPISFRSQIYTENKNLDYTFPEHCINIFCNWRIENPLKREINMKMYATRASEQDLVEVEYSHSHQKITPRFEMLTKSGNFSHLQFSFIRFNVTAHTDIELHLEWTYSLNCECPDSEVYLQLNEEKILTSTNYPEAYCINLNCKTLISTIPNATIILEINHIEIDENDDSLEIYDGQAAVPIRLIKEFFGRFTNLQYSTTQNHALLLFQSDDEQTLFDKGYNITVKSVILNDTTTSKSITTTTTSVYLPTSFSNSTDVSIQSSNSHIFLFSFLFLVIVVAIGVFFYRRRFLRKSVNIEHDPRNLMIMRSEIF